MWNETFKIYPEHDCLNLDVQVGRLRLLEAELRDGLLQVEGERVQPQARDRVQADLHRVDVREELGRGHCVREKEAVVTFPLCQKKELLEGLRGKSISPG